MFSLKKLFGKQVKVTSEAPTEKEMPLEWYEEIVGKRGFIYPQSLIDNTVCVQTTHILYTKMMALFGNKAIAKRHGDTEYEFIIPVDLVKSTFRYIKPKRRRQLSEEQKAVLRARCKAFRRPVASIVSALEAPKT